jgi:hypothetical protein
VTVAGLVHLTADPAWAEAAATADLCLDHFLALIAEGPAAAPLSAIETRQLARLRELEERLESFVQRSSHDRRHLITDPERASLAAAASLLGGDRDRGRGN